MYTADHHNELIQSDRLTSVAICPITHSKHSCLSATANTHSARNYYR